MRKSDSASRWGGDYKYFQIRNIYCKCKTEIGRSIVNYAMHRLMLRYNADIPANIKLPETTVFPHGIFGIFISHGAIIGENCTIFHQVTIGSNTLLGHKKYGAPVIGDNVYIGAGAKIIGRCIIGNNVRIGAGCVVTVDIPDNTTVVMEKPRIIMTDRCQNNTFHSWGEV